MKKRQIKYLVILLVFLNLILYLNTVKADTSYFGYQSIPHKEWTKGVFYFSNGDRMVSSWHSINDSPIDVYILNETNYDSFSKNQTDPTINATLSEFNSTDGYLELEVTEPGLYFGVFHMNYSESTIYFHVSLIRNSNTGNNTYYVNETYVDNTYVNNTNYNQTFENTYNNQTFENNTYDDGFDEKIYINSPKGVGILLSTSLLVGSCISLLPYAFKQIKNRIKDSKKRLDLGDI